MRRLLGLCSALLAAAVVCTAADSALPPDPGAALREAARTGDSKRARALLAAGTAVDAATRHNLTPLSLAAGEGHLAGVRLLVARGADVDARETFFGTTPLSQALDGEHVEVVRFLLQRGAAGAGDALLDAAKRGDLRTARVALATERVEPLELAAALRALDPAAPGSLRALLEKARVERPARAPYGVSPEVLARYAGRYRDEQGSEVAVAVRESGLALATSGEPELVVAPIGRDRFESAAGDAGVLFEGRGGLIERLRINRQGDVRELAAVIADPQPLATAEPDASPQAAREAARPWPQFRGTRASGNGDGQGVPASWSVATGESIRFKTAIPGIALSSPIVWGDRIFVSTAVGAAGDATFRTGLYGDATSVDDLSEHSFRLLALDARSGEVVWDREVWRGRPTVKRHTKSSLANATPATDGQRVIVLFGAVGQLAAYDFAGEQLWRRDVGVLDCNDPQAGAAEWGHASSPILHGDRVVVQADRRVDSFIAAYRLDDGSPLWRVAREEPSTWSTPNVLAAPGGDELVTNGQTIRGYDPTDGTVLWTLGPNSEVVVSTPVVGEAMVYVTAGYPPIRPIYAIRPGQRGDLRLADGQRSSAAIAWSHDRGGTYIPTPIVYRGLLYTVNNNGILTAYDARTGKQIYQTRLGSGGSAFSASPVAADGRLYFAAETGEVHVLRAGADYALLSTQSMDEIVMATPAISDGLLVVRTLGHVVGIGAAPTTAREAPASDLLVRGVRLFDGERVVPVADVLVRGGLIRSVQRSIEAGPGATVVDGSGKTLLPGLIDAHTHVFEDVLRDALAFGVTTELDMFTDHRLAATLRDEQAAGRADGRADLYSAGILVTAPEGHGTEYGMVIPTISAPTEAQAFVDARIAEGSDWIKIVHDDGRTYGISIPTIDVATMKAVIDAAHARRKLAVVHIGDLAGARAAIESGADGLVHLFVDRAPDAAFAALVKERGAFVIPTLTVLDSVTGRPSGAGLVGDTRLAPFLSPQAVIGLETAFPQRPGSRNTLDHALDTVRRLHAAGVPVLAGSDAPNPGTAHGPSIHRELELLVRAGLTPLGALRAATSASARAFGLTDRGRIAEGLRADLVLVNGDPTTDITQTRDIVAVWKRGVPMDRVAFRAAVARATADALAGAPVPAGSGIVSDFDDGSVTSAFGAGWTVSTDAMAGGKSTAEMTVAAGGAVGSAGAMSVAGQVDGGLSYAWSGVLYSPGAALFQPANLSAKRGISFWTMGDGHPYRLMVFSQRRGRMPLIRPFVAPEEWTQVTIPFAAFDGYDGKDLIGVVFAAGPEPGPFAFRIDAVRFE